MNLTLPIAAVVIGLILYLIPNIPAKVTEVGRIMFWTGLLALLLRANELSLLVR